MTNIPDASANPILDELAEPSADLLGKTANAADEMLLQYQLGLNLDMAMDARTIAGLAATQIISLIDITRYGIVSDVELRNLMEQNIDVALRNVRGRRRASGGISLMPERQMRALEVSKAIIRSLDKRLLDDMTRHATLDIHADRPMGAPVGLQDFELCLVDVPLSDDPNPKTGVVIIDTRNTFWVESGPFTNADELEAAFKGKKLQQIGIRIVRNTLAPDQPIPDAMATYLAQYAVVRLNNRDRLPNSANKNSFAGLLQIQGMLREQHQFNRILRDGSDNTGSAAFASSILMRYKDIASVLGGPGLDIERNLRQARTRRDLVGLIKKAEALPAMQVSLDWESNREIERSYTAAIGSPLLLPGGPGGVITLGAGATAINIPISAGPGKDERAQVLRSIDEIAKKARGELAEYRKMNQLLQAIAQKAFEIDNTLSCALIGLYSIRLGPPRTIGDPAYGMWDSSINIASLISEVQNHEDLKLNENHEEEIKKLEKNQKDIKAGKITNFTGDAAQHAVIAKYFEQYHHCSPTEANQAAQYMRSQLLLDKQTVTMTDQIADELVPEVRGRWRVAGDVIANTFKSGGRNFLGATDRDMLIDIAYACGVRRIGKNFRDWEGASYPKLLTAYYTMQAFINKKEPAKVRLPSTQRVIDEQKRIIAAITGKHASLLLRDFGAAQNITGEQAEAIKKDPTKPEHMQLILEMLEGDPPVGYKNRIDKAAGKVNDHHERGWRAAQTVVGTGWKVAKGGAVLGAQYVIAKPAAAVGGVVAKTASNTKKFVGGNKGSLATFAIASLAGGPLVGGLAALAYKAISGEKTNAASHANSH